MPFETVDQTPELPNFDPVHLIDVVGERRVGFLLKTDCYDPFDPGAACFLSHQKRERPVPGDDSQFFDLTMHRGEMLLQIPWGCNKFVGSANGVAYSHDLDGNIRSIKTAATQLLGHG